MTTPFDDLFTAAADAAARFREMVGSRAVAARVTDPGALEAAFGAEIPEVGRAARQVLDQLIEAAEPGLVASTGPRYFGFVIGGALPAASAADIMAVGWDQVAFSPVNSPAAAAVETVTARWLLDVLGLPPTASVGFVTGAQAANTAGLAAARHHVLDRAGCNVETAGLNGAPRIRVVIGDERHATIDRSLRLLGLGTDAVETIRADGNGAMDVEDLRKVLQSRPQAPLIVCLQSGNVNTGAFDNLRAACDLIHETGGWAHVDGAFGLWAAVSPSTRHLVDGVELADSWGCDAHKWLNVPYDSAFAICSRPDVHEAAMSYTAAYLGGSADTRTAMGAYTAESSRRARGFAVWAALSELGRSGIAALIDRNCRLARRFAEQLSQAGFEIGNDVVLNQVLVSFGTDDVTDAVIDGVQREGTCWMGGTTWRGRRFMRVAVSNYATTDHDVDLSVAAIRRVAEQLRISAEERGGVRTPR